MAASVLLLVVVLHGAACLRVEEKRPVVSCAEDLPGFPRRFLWQSRLEHRQHIASDDVLQSEGIACGERSGAADEFLRSAVRIREYEARTWPPENWTTPDSTSVAPNSARAFSTVSIRASHLGRRHLEDPADRAVRGCW